MTNSDSARRVQETIVANFIPERVHHFVSSSIGFGLDKEGVFHLASFAQMADPVPDDDSAGPQRRRLVSLPHPINVLEPVLTLARHIQRRAANQR